jgi:hypothetical protein
VKVENKVTCILRLGNGNSFLGLQYLEAKEIMQKNSICHFKFLLKAQFLMVKNCMVTTKEDKVIVGCRPILRRKVILGANLF